MPGPDDMIERVAKALFTALDPQSGLMSESDLVHTPYDESREAWARVAEAAIRAMREPSDAMVTAFCEAMNEHAMVEGPAQLAAPCFQAMVDAALPSPAANG